MKKYFYAFFSIFLIFCFFPKVQGNTILNTDMYSSSITSEDTVYHTETITICHSELPFFYANNLYTEGGDYEFALKTTEGKDSIITLQLIVLNIPQQPDKIIGDIIINDFGYHMYKINPVQDASEYSWAISNLQWVISKSNKTDSTKLFIPTGGNGILSVSAINKCGISATTQLPIQSTLHIEDFTLTSNISLYPNPSKDIITLTIQNKIIENTELFVYDTYGKLLIKDIITNQSSQIDVINLAAGMYFIKINRANKTIKTFKIYKN